MCGPECYDAVTPRGFHLCPQTILDSTPVYSIYMRLCAHCGAKQFWLHYTIYEHANIYPVPGTAAKCPYKWSQFCQRHITTLPLSLSGMFTSQPLPLSGMFASQHCHCQACSHHNIATVRHVRITTLPLSGMFTSQYRHCQARSHHNMFTSRHCHCQACSHHDIATVRHVRITTLPLSGMFTSQHCHCQACSHHNIATVRHVHITTLPLSGMFTSQHCDFQVTTLPLFKYVHITTLPLSNMFTSQHCHVCPLLTDIVASSLPSHTLLSSLL